MASSFSAELINVMEKNTAAMTAVRDDVQALRTEMRLHNSEQKTFEELARKHEIQLNGDGKTLGIVHQVAQLSKSMSNIERAVWVVVGVILTGLTVALLGLL